MLLPLLDVIRIFRDKKRKGQHMEMRKVQHRNRRESRLVLFLSQFAELTMKLSVLKGLGYPIVFITVNFKCYLDMNI